MKNLLLIFSALIFTSCISDFSTPEYKRIVFFGDSITEAGVHPNGYITLIKDSLKNQKPSVTIFGAGVGGNKVPDLQNRLSTDVLAKEPTMVFIYIGINDVWHSILPGGTGTPKDVYESGLRDLISKIQDAKASVILCTPSVIGERWDGKNQLDKELDEYAEISRTVASETNTPLCDLRTAFIDYLKIYNSHNAAKGILTLDGVHLNDAGNKLVADEMMNFIN